MSWDSRNFEDDPKRKFYYKNRLVTEELLDQFDFDDWYSFVCNENNKLTIQFMEKYHRFKTLWRQVAFHYNFTEDIIEQFWPYMTINCWEVLAAHGQLTERTIREFSSWLKYIKGYWYFIQKYSVKKFGKDFEREFEEHWIFDTSGPDPML